MAMGQQVRRRAGRARRNTSPLQWSDGSDLLAHSSACVSAMRERAATAFADEIEDDEPTAQKRSVIEEITIHIMAR